MQHNLTCNSSRKRNESCACKKYSSVSLHVSSPCCKVRHLASVQDSRIRLLTSIDAHVLPGPFAEAATLVHNAIEKRAMIWKKLSDKLKQGLGCGIFRKRILSKPFTLSKLYQMHKCSFLVNGCGMQSTVLVTWSNRPHVDTALLHSMGFCNLTTQEGVMTQDLVGNIFFFIWKVHRG